MIASVAFLCWNNAAPLPKRRRYWPDQKLKLKCRHRARPFLRAKSCHAPPVISIEDDDRIKTIVEEGEAGDEEKSKWLNNPSRHDIQEDRQMLFDEHQVRRERIIIILILLFLSDSNSSRRKRSNSLLGNFHTQRSVEEELQQTATKCFTTGALPRP